jgi:DNA modification methylase
MEKDDTKSRVHPTQKPAILNERFIKKFSKDVSDKIVDLY